MDGEAGLVFVPKVAPRKAHRIKQKTPARIRGGAFVLYWAPGGDLLSRGQSALSSAQSRFTVLFGMGRRGSNSLWPPSKRVGRRLQDAAPHSWAYGFNNLEEVQLGSNRQHKQLEVALAFTQS